MRPYSPAFRVLLLASATVIPLATVKAQAPASPTTQASTADAIRVLLDQANYWRSKDEPQRADEALGRVLSLDPNNPDGLAAQAQAAAERGNQQVAQAALAKLRAVRPDDPRIDSIQQVLRAGPLDNGALSEARRLAQAGKPADAVAAYRRAFRGDTPPPSLAAEYYQTLASVDGSWDVAREGLAAQVRTNPQDLRTQLAYAQALTYHEGTRADGVDRLAALSQLPSIRQQARLSWRQALLWSDDNDRTQAQLNTYLQQNPTDADLDAKKTELSHAVIDPGTRSRLGGYEALEGKQFAEAERDFTASLAFNPNDVDSMTMLAVIRRQQGRSAEATKLIDKAISLAPDRKDELLSAFGNNGSANGAGDNGEGARQIRRDYADVAALTKRGDFAAAETKLLRLMGDKPNPGTMLQLGDIQARAGHLARAEASFRAALRGLPRNKGAMLGLAGVLQREGKVGEAQTLFARAGVNPGRGQGSGQGAQSSAQVLLDRALANPDLEARVTQLRAVLAANSSSPWTRLELARALMAQNKPDDARQVMTPVIDARRPTVDQLRAAIYYADSAQDYPLVLSLVARLPVNARTPEMRAAAIRADAAADLRDASSQPDTTSMERRMIALASKPDPSGERVVGFAQRLLKAGDKSGTREVIRTALNASRPPSVEQRIAYGGMLIAAGYPGDAKIVTAGLQQDRLSTVEKTNLAAIQDGVAVISSDKLASSGATADAYNELAPRLAQSPDDPDLNMALARIYEVQKQPAKALAITEGLFKRNPSSLSVRVAVIGAALAAGNTGRAAEVAAQTKQEFSEEPQAWLASAQVARAQGKSGAALSDLRTAKALREKQLDSSSSSDASDVMRDGWLPGRQYALNTPRDVANDASPLAVSGVSAAEPVTREYERYAQYLPPTPLDDSSPAPAAAPAAAPVGPPTDLEGSQLLAPSSGSAPASSSLPAPAAPVSATQSLPPADNPALQSNPFRTSSSPTQDEPNVTPDGLQTLRGTAASKQPADPLTADIDRSIQQVSEDVAPRLEASVLLRGRSGDTGLSKLFDLEAPLEASFSPNGYGRLKVQVTPVALFAQQISATDEANFGSNPLVANTTTFSKGKSQTAFGTGLDVGYAYDFISADIGSSPLGFREERVLGGIEFSPRLTNDLLLRVTGERRSVTDSLLSYAGQHDPQSGENWGGVTRNRGHLQLEGTVGTANYYAGAGGAVYEGTDVKSNTEVEAGAGFSLPVWTTATQEVRVGTDVVYFGFDKNLGGFTLGNGGYFSPQQFFAALFPVNYKQQLTPDLNYSVGGSVGVQSFRAKSQLVFPNDPALQSALVQLASTNAGVTTRSAGFRDTAGIAGGAHADIDYRLTNNLHIGARAGFDRSGNFTEGTGLVYARYVFNDPL